MNPELVIIAAVTRDMALGRGGDLLYHISADLKRFKQLTMGCPVIMGRKTFESFPNGPLPGRENIVITRNPDYRRQGIKTASSLDEAVNKIMNATLKCFVIGGGEIYRQALPLADRLELTEIDAVCPEADTHFPGIDPKVWRKVSESEWFTDPRSGVAYRFVTYCADRTAEAPEPGIS